MQFFTDNKVKCTKLQGNLKKGFAQQYDCFMQLNESQNQLVITKKVKINEFGHLIRDKEEVVIKMDNFHEKHSDEKTD
jgi:hypothetical protein